MNQTRTLAAILSADVAGFSRLMGDDEAATVEALDASREIFRERVAAHGGRVVDTAGDSVLAMFGSAVEAVQGSIEIQAAIAERNREVPEARRMKFRIGINLGDIIHKDDGTIYGDGVNIAARLEGLAEAGGVCIAGNVRDLSAGHLKLATEDLGEQSVKNIAAPVRAYRLRLEDDTHNNNDTVSDEAARFNDLTNKPTIAVLPFENLSGDTEQDFFAEGIAEDIITELSKIRSLTVIARNSSFAFKEQGGNVGSIAKQLGARFMVHGSVRKSGNRARITAELIDAASDSQLWAERYDRQLDDVFSVQDEITRKIVSILPSRIEAADLRRVQSKPTASLAAYENLLRGKYHHHKGTAEDNRIGLEMLNRALELDPDYAEAYAWRACTIAQALVRGYAADANASDQLMESLHTALALNDDDFETHRILSGVSLARRDYDRAEFHAARALELNPNDPRVISQYGEVLTAVGKAEDGIIELERALQVDPYKPDRRLTHLGVAEFVAHHYADAIKTFKRISALEAKHHSYLAACYAQLGEVATAERHAAQTRREDPGFDAGEFVAQLPYKDDADRQHHLDALASAGLLGQLRAR